MIKEKIIYGIYDDDDVILNAVKAIRKEGQHINDVYSPFPIHGLDHALGLKYSRLAICSFLFGLTGFCCALLLMWAIMIYDWPMDIGGKPSFSMLENFIRTHIFKIIKIFYNSIFYILSNFIMISVCTS